MKNHDCFSPLIVPEPWQPLRTSCDENSVTVEVVGRCYRFSNHAALPNRIYTAEKDVLAGPIQVKGTLYGKPIEWQSPFVALLQQNDSCAVLCGAMETEGVIINVSTKVTYDGMIRFDVMVIPYLSNFRKGAERAAGLEQLWIEIPLLQQFATLYTYWPLDTGGVVSAMLPVNSGAVPPQGFALPFKPFLWLGWEGGGLSWFAESDRKWQPSESSRAIEVLRENGKVVLRLHLLDNQPLEWRGNMDSWYKPNPPITFTFGLQATPVKPVNEDLLKWRIVHVNYYEALEHLRIEQHPASKENSQTILDRVADAGANVIVLHEAWNNIQNYWVNNQADAVKNTVKACHARGIKIIPYFGYELSTIAPEWADWHERVLIKNADGRYRGGWQRWPPQRDYMVCYGSEWQEKWLKGIEWMLDEYGFDGLYLDGTIMPSSCANQLHGCGYIAPDGILRETYPIFSVRMLMERLYHIVSKRGGIITAHQSSCCLTPTLQYCHTYWDGEHIGGAFRFGEDGIFPLAVFRAEFMGCNFGIPAEFLSYSPQSLAFTLLHNVMVRPGVGELLNIVSSVWKVFQRYGTSVSKWIPYWQSKHVAKSNVPYIYVSAYVRDNNLLLVTSNLHKEMKAIAEIKLIDNCSVPLKYTKARDAISGENIIVSHNCLSVELGSMEWKLIEVCS